MLDGRASPVFAAGPDRLRVDESPAADSLAWLVLTPGDVSIHSGKVELGTGVQTALTTLLFGAGPGFQSGVSRIPPSGGTLLVLDVLLQHREGRPACGD